MHLLHITHYVQSRVFVKEQLQVRRYLYNKLYNDVYVTYES